MGICPTPQLIQICKRPVLRRLARNNLVLGPGTSEDILRVQEIRSYEAPTRLAGAPPAVIGLMNLRGVIVPILDLRVHLGRAADVDGNTVIIVLNVGGKILGAVVDAVSFVVALSSRQIKPLPEMRHGVASGYIDGIATLDSSQGDQLLILLDIERMMSSPEVGLKLTNRQN